MLQSSIAQAATERWRGRTLGLLALILVVHIACFAVLTMEIDRRYKNAEAVNSMADILAASQQATMRASFMQVSINCWSSWLHMKFRVHCCDMQPTWCCVLSV